MTSEHYRDRTEREPGIEGGTWFAFFWIERTKFFKVWKKNRLFANKTWESFKPKGKFPHASWIDHDRSRPELRGGGGGEEGGGGAWEVRFCFACPVSLSSLCVFFFFHPNLEGGGPPGPFPGFATIYYCFIVWHFGFEFHLRSSPSAFNLVGMNDLSTSWLLYHLLHRTYETKQGRNSSPRL